MIFFSTPSGWRLQCRHYLSCLDVVSKPATYAMCLEQSDFLLHVYNRRVFGSIIHISFLL